MITGRATPNSVSFTTDGRRSVVTRSSTLRALAALKSPQAVRNCVELAGNSVDESDCDALLAKMDAAASRMVEDAAPYPNDEALEYVDGHYERGA